MQTKILESLGHEVILYDETNDCIEIGTKRDGEEYFLRFSPSEITPAVYFHARFLEFYAKKHYNMDLSIAEKLKNVVAPDDK